jgi:hypothetical protein
MLGAAINVLLALAGGARGGNGGASGYGASAAAESNARYAFNVRTSI